MKRQRSWMGGAILVAVGMALASPARAEQAAEPLPADVRLTSVRAQLQAAVDQAEREGLPTRPLVTKVREGLAKGAPPERIVVAVEGLARGLDDANRFARAHGRPAASPALLEALAVARAAGASDQAALPLVASKMDDRRLVQSVDVLGELTLRGYPGAQAGQIVRDVAEHDPGAIGHLVAGLESIRRGQTVSRADALEALGANLAASGNSLDAAVNRSIEGSEHGAAASNGKSGGQGSAHAGGASKKGLAKGMK